MKKVLLLTENFPPIEGGSGRWFWELYSRLPRDKVIICTHNIEGGGIFDNSHGVTVIRLPLRNSEWGLKSLSGLRFYLANLIQIIKLVKRQNIEEIHCGRVIHEGVIAWLVKLLRGTPYRCFIHGEDVETVATSREQTILVKQVCKHAISLVCNSYNSQELVVSLGFASKQKCVVLHPGVNSDVFVPSPSDVSVRQKFGWNEKALVLLTVGRLQRRKGQDFLIEAMPYLLKQIPNLQYAIVGKGEEYLRLTQLIEKHQLQESVFIHDDFNDDDLIKAYQQCDIFVLPNRTIENDIEGFGMVLVEAQSCGKPVIAGNSGGTSETLMEESTGFIVDCSSPEVMQSSLPQIIKKCMILDRSYISDYAKTRFNWGKHTKLFLNLINMEQ